MRSARRAAAVTAEECRVKFAREISTEMSTPPPWFSHSDGVRITLIVLVPAEVFGETFSPCVFVARDFASRMRRLTSVGSRRRWKGEAWPWGREGRGVPGV